MSSPARRTSNRPEIPVRTGRRNGLRFRPNPESLEARAMLTVAGPWASGDTVVAASALLLKFKAETPSGVQAAALDAVGGRVVQAYPSGPSVVSLAPWADVDAALAALKSDPAVSYAEADATLHAKGSVIPNDPKFPQQWGLSTIDAPQAWSITQGNKSTIVAVLDTGIDLRNAEFAGRLWTNPDASNRTRTVYGWNFVANNGNPQDDNGHGSHVSGVIGANGNNNLGVAGVNWNAQIMPLKVLDSMGDGATDTSIAAIYYAVQHGAKVINASWGGDLFSQSMLDALNFADAHNVVFVTAAGNEASNNDVITTYPASYRTGNELVVAAIQADGSLATYSNYGNGVDVAAPGTDIVSTVPGGYDSYTGTSMATPYVTGVVSLLAGLHPDLTARQLVSLVKSTVKPLPTLAGFVNSGGVVDAYFAVTNHVTNGGGNSASGSKTPTLVPGASTPEDVEDAILSNDGFYAAVGGNIPAFVNTAFNAILARSADVESLVYFANAIAGGTSRSVIVRALQNTPEAQRTRVARWDRSIFGYTDSVASLKIDQGVIYLAGLLNSGWSDTSVQSLILSTDTVYAARGGTPAGWVTLAFGTLLGRDPDPTSVAYFSNALASGVSRDSVVRSLIATEEGRRATVARIYRDDLGEPRTVDQLKSDVGVIYWAGYLGG